MVGAATPVQLAGFLVALRAKGETVDELKGLADAMVSHARPLDVPAPAVDIVGTGGDRLRSVNISTMSALVAAGAGARVVKHGNRASSSKSGSADCLEALGVQLDMPVSMVESCAREVGITFCFAQTFHPAMRHAAPTRRELGIGTVFNSLGPLTNPGQPAYAAIGVADERLAGLIAGVFATRRRPAIVFRGADGLDELALAGPSQVWWVADGEVGQHSIGPRDVGLMTAPLEALRGGDPAYNAQVVRELLAGRGREEPWAPRDAVLLNAGAGFAVARGGLGAEADTADLVAALRAGVAEARASIDSGAAAQVLDRWVAATRA